MEGSSEPAAEAPEEKATGCMAVTGRWLRLFWQICVLDRPYLATMHIFMPFAIYFTIKPLPPTNPFGDCISFFVCLLALIPLAELLGYATEQVRCRL